MGVPGKLLFLDSGAHGLYSRFVIEQQHKHGYDFYTTREFYLYLDAYGEFIQQHPEVTVYANVDVIFDPKLSHKAQRYLERRYGVRPIPVIHYGTPLKYLRRYINRGYEYIALGGLGQEVHRNQYTEWADGAFHIICGGRDHLPKARVHGFAITSFPIMQRYPWYSVDSTSWLLHTVRGTLLVPQRRGESWNYSESPHFIQVAHRKRNPSGHIGGEHLAKVQYHKLVDQYLADTGFQKGVSHTSYDKLTNTKHEEVVEKGVFNDHYIRGSLNARFYLEFARTLPTWPWPFFRSKPPVRRSLRLV